MGSQSIYPRSFFLLLFFVIYPFRILFVNYLVNRGRVYVIVYSHYINHTDAKSACLTHRYHHSKLKFEFTRNINDGSLQPTTNDWGMFVGFLLSARNTLGSEISSHPFVKWNELWDSFSCGFSFFFFTIYFNDFPYLPLK